MRTIQRNTRTAAITEAQLHVQAVERVLAADALDEGGVDLETAMWACVMLTKAGRWLDQATAA